MVGEEMMKKDEYEQPLEMCGGKGSVLLIAVIPNKALLSESSQLFLREEYQPRAKSQQMSHRCDNSSSDNVLQ